MMSEMQNDEHVEWFLKRFAARPPGMPLEALLHELVDRVRLEVGRTIVKVDMQGRWETDTYGGCREYMHDPAITLDDGSVLRFHVEEHPTGDGGAYGVDILRVRPDRRTSSASGDQQEKR
jgi:hypothetical protein